MPRSARRSQDRGYLRRRVASREPKRTFFLFTEGGKTEPAYFRAYGLVYRDALIRIEIENPGSDPFTLAQTALAFAQRQGLARRPGENDNRPLQSYEENDQVWVVYDRDAHPAGRLNDAKQLCQANSIGIAFSNPCFELWLILHEEDYDRPDDRHAVQAHYRTLRPEYDPSQGKCPDCADVVQRAGEASGRAERQVQRREQDGGERPLTTVFRLVQAIEAAAAEAHPRSEQV